MRVHPSGYYAWLKEPLSEREKENRELLRQIKEAYAQSRKTYGYRGVHKDLIESGIVVNKKRVARLMKLHGLYGTGTLKKRPRHKAGRPHKAHPNHLGQCFAVNKPNEAWVTDITYIRTYEGWLYLAVVMDLFSRKIIGWAMSHRMTSELARSLARIRRWGAAALFFSWVPVVGDGLCLAGGWLRLPWLPSLGAMLLGKSLRYVVLAWSVQVFS